jgi:hypothetical protein
VCVNVKPSVTHKILTLEIEKFKVGSLVCLPSTVFITSLR